MIWKDNDIDKITERKYEYGESYIEFLDLPESYAETLVCYDLLYQIMGNYDYNTSNLYYDTVQSYIDEGQTDSGVEWIKVDKVNEISLDDLKASKFYDELFVQLIYVSGFDGQYEEYVRKILDNGCVIVYIKYRNKYTEEVSLNLPQSPDGEHEEYWLLVPDQDNQLKLFDNTRYYMLFNIYDKNMMPEALNID